MEQAENHRKSRPGVVLVVALVCAAVVGAGLMWRASRRSSGSSPFRPVPTTAPYNPHPGTGGTRVLTEPVDPLSLAVPDSWQSPAPDPLTLREQLDKFAQQAPPLAVLLQAEGEVAVKSAVRLFAFQPAAPHAYVSVVSFSSPAATTPTPSAIDGIVAAAKKQTSNVLVSGAKLPAGEVIKLDSSLVSQNVHIVVEVLVLIAGGRTVEIQLVSETMAAAIPPVFDQIAQSLRLG